MHGYQSAMWEQCLKNMKLPAVNGGALIVGSDLGSHACTVSQLSNCGAHPGLFSLEACVIASAGTA